ncbi:hypothetical protein FRC11_013081, partial [Ceratobasidium sp. 423]
MFRPTAAKAVDLFLELCPKPVISVTPKKHSPAPSPPLKPVMLSRFRSYTALPPIPEEVEQTPPKEPIMPGWAKNPTTIHPGDRQVSPSQIVSTGTLAKPRSKKPLSSELRQVKKGSLPPSTLQINPTPQPRLTGKSRCPPQAPVIPTGAKPVTDKQPRTRKPAVSASTSTKEGSPEGCDKSSTRLVPRAVPTSAKPTIASASKLAAKPVATTARTPPSVSARSGSTLPNAGARNTGTWTLKKQ